MGRPQAASKYSSTVTEALDWKWNLPAMVSGQTGSAQQPLPLLTTNAPDPVHWTAPPCHV